MKMITFRQALLFGTICLVAAACMLAPIVSTLIREARNPLVWILLPLMLFTPLLMLYGAIYLFYEGFQSRRDKPAPEKEKAGPFCG